MITGLLIIGAIFWFIAGWSGGLPGATAGFIFMMPGLLFAALARV